jgi:hypothetical protein
MCFKLHARLWWQFRALYTLGIFGFLSVARCNFFLSVVRQPNLEIGCLNFEVYRSHTITQSTHSRTQLHTHTHTITHLVGTPANKRSARSRGRCLHYTQQTQDNNIIAFRGIWTHTPSNHAASNLHLRTHGHRDRSTVKLKCLNEIYNNSRPFVNKNLI